MANRVLTPTTVSSAWLTGSYSQKFCQTWLVRPVCIFLFSQDPDSIRLYLQQKRPPLAKQVCTDQRVRERKRALQSADQLSGIFMPLRMGLLHFLCPCQSLSHQALCMYCAPITVILFWNVMMMRCRVFLYV